MGMIFPVNWKPSWEKCGKRWKTIAIQNNICPACHCYGARFQTDHCCQKCGYRLIININQKDLNDLMNRILRKTGRHTLYQWLLTPVIEKWLGEHGIKIKN